MRIPRLASSASFLCVLVSSPACVPVGSSAGSTPLATPVRDVDAVLSALESLLATRKDSRGNSVGSYAVTTAGRRCEVDFMTRKEPLTFAKGATLMISQERVAGEGLHKVENTTLVAMASGKSWLSMVSPVSGKYDIEHVRPVTSKDEATSVLRKNRIILELAAPGKPKRIFVPRSGPTRADIDCIGDFSAVERF